MNRAETVGDARDGAAAERVRERLGELFAQGKIRGENGLNNIFPIGLSAERGRIVREICLAIRPRSTLEVGMGWGISTLIILEALLTSEATPVRHVAVDPFQATTFHNAARMTLRELKLEEHVEFYPEMSMLALPRLFGQGRRFDFVFIDGDHRFDACFPDFCIVHHLLKPAGVVLFDDTWADAVQLTANYAVRNLGYTELAAPCEVPVHCARPMMRALAKPVQEVARNGLWTEPLTPFFEQRPGNGVSREPPTKDSETPRSIAAELHRAAQELLDLVAGNCRSARILFNRAYATRALVALAQSEELLADLSRAIAQPQPAAAAGKLLASIGAGINAMKKERDGAPAAAALAAIEQLKELLRQQLQSPERAGAAPADFVR